MTKDELLKEINDIRISVMNLQDERLKVLSAYTEEIEIKIYDLHTRFKNEGIEEEAKE